ncbi:hypothetical protein T439DRAFT_47771 [Meredithblackwellia eburnea MCA 4105]
MDAAQKLDELRKAGAFGSSKPGTTKRQKQDPKSKGEMRSLEIFTSLPVEIFLEILSQVTPPDLVNLSQLSKKFRDLLLSLSCSSLWRAARQTIGVDKLGTNDVSDMQLITFFYDNKCQECGAANVPKADFTLRLKLCRRCREQEWIKPWNLPKGLHSKTSQCLPRTSYTAANWNKPGKSRGWVSITRAIQISDILKRLDSNDLRKDFVSSRRDYCQKVYQDSAILHSLANTSEYSTKAFRADEKTALAQRSRKRAEDIKQKCLDLGYQKHEFNRSFSTSSVVNKPELLTEQIWTNIKASVIRTLEKDRAAETIAVQQQTMRENQLQLRDAHDKLCTEAKSPETFIIFGDFVFLNNVRPFWENGPQFSSEEWEAKLSVIEGEIDNHAAARRIFAIRSILAATTGTPLQEIDDNPASYPKESFDDDFFEKLSSHLFCSLPSCCSRSEHNRRFHVAGKCEKGCRTIAFATLPALLRHHQDVHSKD